MDFPNENKNEVFPIFVRFRTSVENIFTGKIKMFQSDEGGEYTSHAFCNDLTSNGIYNHFSCPKHSEQNSLAQGRP